MGVILARCGVLEREKSALVVLITLDHLTSPMRAEAASACFKVYVITTTGNEKGSNDMSITRPLAPTP